MKLALKSTLQVLQWHILRKKASPNKQTEMFATRETHPFLGMSLEK